MPQVIKNQLILQKVLQRVAEQHQGQFILGLVNCETEQMIAAQFRIQALPTTYLFKEAQAIDAFPGALDEASLLQRLSAILPKEEDLKFQKALDFLQSGRLRLCPSITERSLGAFR